MTVDWSEYAKYYDNLSKLRAYSELVDQFVNACGKFFNSSIVDGSILDLGCGTGSIAIRLKKKFPNSTVDAIDNNEEMLKIAREKALGDDLDINFQHVDIETVELNNKYDLITMNNVLYIIRDKLPIIKEISGLLNPNGILIISDPVPVDHYRYGKIVRRQFRSFKDFLTGLSVLKSMIKIYKINQDIDGSYKRYSRDMYKNLFKSIGLEIISVEKSYAGQANLFVLKKQNV